MGLKTFFAFIFFLNLGFVKATDLDWKAEVRVRMEKDTSDVVDDNHTGVATRTHLRSRLRLRLTSGSVSAVLQGQAAELLGAQGSPLYGKDSLLTLHQVYGKIADLLVPGWTLYVGRFEFQLGKGRLFSSNWWDNQGNVMEGVNLVNRHWPGLTNVFHFIIRETYQTMEGDKSDATLDGVYLKPQFPPLETVGFDDLSIYWFREQNPYGSGLSNERITWGGAVEYSLFWFTLEVEGALQTGQVQPGVGIAGKMLASNLRVNWPFVPVWKRLLVGWEYYSGDELSTANEAEGFANPYGERHDFHGQFDLHQSFTSNYFRGLEEFHVSTELNLWRGISLNLAYYQFADGLADRGNLGREWDVTLVATYNDRLALRQGYARYWYGSAASRTGMDEFAYTMLTITL